MSNRYGDIADKFVGKRANPSSPQPQHKEKPDTENLIRHTEHEKLPHHIEEVKPLIPHRKPHFNVLYGSLGTENGWRYTIDNYATGSFTSGAVNVPVLTPVTLAQAQTWKLMQWPGAVNMYLCLRRFSIAPYQVSDIPSSVEVQIPATAGALTVTNQPGVLVSAVVTATGASALTFQDGAGNIIGEVLSSATVGQEISFNNAFFNTLVANKSATTPVVTITYTPNIINQGGLDLRFIDNAGQIIPLGVIPVYGSSSIDVADLIPTPITDTQNLTVGNLQAMVVGGGAPTGDFYFWQIAFSIAYLIPALKPYDMEWPNANIHHAVR